MYCSECECVCVVFFFRWFDTRLPLSTFLIGWGQINEALWIHSELIPGQNVCFARQGFFTHSCNIIRIAYTRRSMYSTSTCYF